MSGLQSLFLHVAIITPVCQYFLTPGRFPKPRNFIFAIAFLAAVAIAGEWSEWSAKPANLYSVLEVDRSASAAELKKAYRDQTLRWHPDKNKAADAPARFQAVSTAFETLSDPEQRRLYERYGEQVAKDARARAALAARGETDVLMGMAAFYLMWAVLTYLMTIGRGSADARTWSFVGLAVSLMVEFQMVFGDFDPLKSVLKRTPTFEKIALLHALYPPFMHGCRLIAQFTFVDTEAQLQLMLGAIVESNREILISLEQLIQATQQKKKGGEGAAAAAAVASAAAAGGSSAGELRGDESLPLALRLRRRQEAEARTIAAAQARQQAGKGGIPSWVIMAGLMVLLNYFK